MLHTALRPFTPLLQDLCRRFGVQQLYLFGSGVTERFDAARSDVDVLVQLLPAAPLTQGETLLALWAELETILQRRVDLLTPESLQNPFLKAEIDQTKYLIYDAAGTEIPV
ncbi:nucleotidyltransferase family protein [Hymenobacter terrenus]|uniref:nucleotidyltransferase family protein n=1 Tax=Hymenobacter terrenus TaxID=1629124 RepID=UPI0006192E91|nr:nucleotidyltransferase domain-containing protein [Hymenobacter terrenus]